MLLLFKFESLLRVQNIDVLSLTYIKYISFANVVISLLNFLSYQPVQNIRNPNRWTVK